MGAGGKYDPTRIQISDISETFEDPLARAVRIRLKKEGISSGVPVVVSLEAYPVVWINAYLLSIQTVLD